MSEGASIGQILRQRREERSLTVEQAAFQSKIPLRLLQALEEDDYHLLPDALYLIRLLHDLAVFLKLDANALETEFQSAIRRPPRQTLAVGPPPQPPPTIPWKQVVLTVAAISVVTPLVFIVLSLMSKRAAERPAPATVKEQVAAEQSSVEGNGRIVADRFLTMHPEGDGSEVNPASGARLEAPRVMLESVRPGTAPSSESSTPASAGSPRPADPPRQGMESVAKTQANPPLRRSPESTGAVTPAVEPIPRRFVLMARAVEATWMSVRPDGGEQRYVMLQAGQVARFAADTGFVVTLGNAAGVSLTLNGTPVPLLGKSGQVIRDMVLPAGNKSLGSPGAAPSREPRQTTER